MAYDQRSFEADFRERLERKLTISSHPIISELTKHAGAYAQQYDYIIVQLVCEMIDSKWPVDSMRYVYLLDSIVKNLRIQHPPYVQAFSQRIAPVFVKLFHRSPGDVKRELKHVLKTWEDNRVFPSNVLQQIHSQGVYGESKKRSLPVSASLQPAVKVRPRMVSNASAENEWRRLAGVITSTRRDLEPLLKDLHSNLHKNVSIVDAVGVLQRALRSAPVYSTPPPQPPPPAALATMPPHHHLHSSSNFGGNWNVSVSAMPVQPSSAVQIPPPPMPLQQPPMPTVAVVGSFSSRWSTDALRRDPIEIVSLLYNPRQKQCKTCGKRYLRETSIQDHLDWHFRMNERAKRRQKQTVSQQWYISHDEWESGSDFYSELQVEKSVDEVLMEEMEENEEAAVVENVVPATDDSAVCPVCHDTFTTFWDDENDSWMFRQALEVDGRIIHDYCVVPPDDINTDDVAKPAPDKVAISSTPSTPKSSGAIKRNIEDVPQIVDQQQGSQNN